MSLVVPSGPRRWFLYASASLLVVLFSAIILAGLLLMQRGLQPRTGQITGSSMEPTLAGPRCRWECSLCRRSQPFGADSWREGGSLRCRFCGSSQIASVDSILDEIPGSTVEYVPMRAVRKGRQAMIDERSIHPSGLRRGDVVVIQYTPEEPREVKRLVGFPGESISIAAGDLFVDGIRFQKSLTQSLQQSILVDAWEAADSQGTSHEAIPLYGWRYAGNSQPFRGALSDSDDLNESSMLFAPPLGMPSISDELWCNAREPLEVVPTNDIGIAFRIANSPNRSSMTISMSGRRSIRLELLPDHAGAKGFLDGDQILSLTTEQLADSRWWIVAHVDGQLVLGNQSAEWYRADVENWGQGEMAPPIAVRCHDGGVEFDRILVFRDVHYRGSQGADDVAIGPADRFVVIGDNVAYSRDTRHVDRHVVAGMIRGVLSPTSSPLDSLLRQATELAARSSANRPQK